MYAGFVASTTPYFLCQARQPKPFKTSDQKERFTASSGHQTHAIFFCCCHSSCTTYSGQRWMLGMQWQATGPQPPVEDPSPAIVGICLSLLEWYHLYRQPGLTTDELHLLDTTGCAFLDKCSRLFPFVNSKGMNVMCTDKVHFIIHSASEIMKWATSSIAVLRLQK